MSNISHTIHKFYRFGLKYPAGTPQSRIIYSG